MIDCTKMFLLVYLFLKYVMIHLKISGNKNKQRKQKVILSLLEMKNAINRVRTGP